MADEQTPVGGALVICDRAHQDPMTGKITLLGIFSELACDGFPATVGPVSVYIALTEAHGETSVTLRIVDVEEKYEPVLEDILVSPRESHPLALIEQAMTYDELVFPEAGEYRIELLHDGVFFLSRRLLLIDLDDLGAPKEE